MSFGTYRQLGFSHKLSFGSNGHHYVSLLLFFLAAGSYVLLATRAIAVNTIPITPNTELPKHAKDCISFYNTLENGIISNIGNRRQPRTNLSLIGAYAYPNYSVVTIEADGWYGKKVFCHYFDAHWNTLDTIVESVVFPEFAVHCCRHPRAAYMGITEKNDDEVTFTVPVSDRTIDEPKYNLSVCLAPMYGNESKWLMLTELIEHYKLQGVQHMYIYVKDIDEYSRIIFDDYEKSGEIEVVYFRKQQDRLGYHWQMVGVQDCLQRSRHHSRYAMFVDLDERMMALNDQTLEEYVLKAMTEKPNVGALQFRTRYVLRTTSPPDKYMGEITLKKHLPTLVFHNTSAVAPSNHIPKCIIDPRHVLLMWVHHVKMYFPGSKYTLISVPPDKAIIRHYRSLKDNFGKRYPSIMSRIQGARKYGNFTMTVYPKHLMSKLYGKARLRLDRVYTNI